MFTSGSNIGSVQRGVTDDPLVWIDCEVGNSRKKERKQEGKNNVTDATVELIDDWAEP